MSFLESSNQVSTLHRSHTENIQAKILGTSIHHLFHNQRSNCTKIILKKKNQQQIEDSYTPQNRIVIYTKHT